MLNRIPLPIEINILNRLYKFYPGVDYCLHLNPTLYIYERFTFKAWSHVYNTTTMSLLVALDDK